jgi:hypothetical protein
MVTAVTSRFHEPRRHKDKRGFHAPHYRRTASCLYMAHRRVPDSFSLEEKVSGSFDEEPDFRAIRMMTPPGAVR